MLLSSMTLTSSSQPDWQAYIMAESPFTSTSFTSRPSMCRRRWKMSGRAFLAAVRRQRPRCWVTVVEVSCPAWIFFTFSVISSITWLVLEVELTDSARGTSGGSEPPGEESLATWAGLSSRLAPPCSGLLLAPRPALLILRAGS